jgi:hypothetical protein
MFRAKRGQNLSSYTLQPMLVMEMDVPNEDLMPIEFPDNSANLLASEQVAQQYADKVSGVNDPEAGFSDPILKSGGGVQANMFAAQQTATDRSAISENIERAYGEVGMLVMMQLIANSDRLGEMMSVMDPKDAQNISQILQTPIENMPLLVQFAVQTTDIFRSEEAKRNNMMVFSQLYTVYGQQAIGFLQAISSGQVGPDVQAMLGRLLFGSTKIMEKMIDSFDIGKVEDFLPDFSALGGQLKGGLGAGQQANAVAQGIPAEAGFAQGPTGSGFASAGGMPPGA